MARWEISGFQEIRELGRGGQGRVVLARHRRSGAPVAVKYLPPGAEPQERARLLREARMLARVRSPHVTRLYRLVESAEGVALVMEAVDGASLRDVLAEHGALPAEAALAVLKGSLLGLAAAHAVGVVHRDYKPANVVVPADGRSRLIDFGIATETGAASAAGTPSYMAPEQWERHPATPAADVYAATCVFYECVTGRRPYEGDRAAVMRGHLLEPVALEPVPGPLRALVARGMAKEPAARPAGAAEFVGDLERTARAAYGAGWEARGVRALASAAVALASLFPLTAAGLAAASAGGAGMVAGGGGAAGTGVLAMAGGKVALAVAVAGTAAAVTTGTVAVTALSGEEPPRRPAVSAAPSTRPANLTTVSFGKFSLAVPKTWRVRGATVTPTTGDPVDIEYAVRVPGRCTRNPTERRASFPPSHYCPRFEVLGRYSLRPNDFFYGEFESFTLNAPYHLGTDPSHVCPPAPNRYFGIRSGGLLRRGLADVGDRRAEYREWRMICISDNLERSSVTFVQRLWYLPQSQILIVDEWNTPGLARILADAVWT
ncbi:serine/threonine-protein kinase [Thermomonospora umbrina]|uniref:non-specific serine/threonine protein kinase n=1 Tax=Thermomonospora umbrina TaxID=111806 RepID=A0A3D9SY04_9ACTN|nr:serine/threonine-protein kinase [Thermomonospora umbrina]REF00448.1 serine/threonine protein kinase [Thermomonospora umbrina]